MLFLHCLTIIKINAHRKEGQALLVNYQQYKCNYLMKHLNIMVNGQKFEQKLNTKSTQTINISKSVGTQALPETKDTGIQTTETFSNTWNNTSEYDCDVSDEEPPHDLDSSLIATEPSDSDDNLGNNDTEKNNGVKHSAFIVFWSSLMTLFSRYFTCFGKIVSLKGRTC